MKKKEESVSFRKLSAWQEARRLEIEVLQFLQSVTDDPDRTHEELLWQIAGDISTQLAIGFESSTDEEFLSRLGYASYACRLLPRKMPAPSSPEGDREVRERIRQDYVELAAAIERIIRFVRPCEADAGTGSFLRRP